MCAKREKKQRETKKRRELSIVFSFRLFSMCFFKTFAAQPSVFFYCLGLFSHLENLLPNLFFFFFFSLATRSL